MAKVSKSTPILLAIIGWLIVVYPSIIKANWFYLDVPTLITMGKNLFNNNSWLIPDNSGRYLPFYWLYQALIYHILGGRVVYYFFVQAIIILITIILFFKLIDIYKTDIKAKFIFLILFFSVSPFAENIFTVGKPEHLVLFFITTFLITFYLYINCRNRSKTYLLLLINFFTTLFANWSKETSIVLSVFCIFTLLVLYILRKETELELIRRAFFFTLINIIGTVLARLPIYFFHHGSSYTTYEISIQLVLENLKYYCKNQPDVMVTTLISVLLFGSVLFNRKKGNLTVIRFSMLFGILMMTLSYFAGLLLWRWPFGYYQLVTGVLSIYIISVLLFEIEVKKYIYVIILSVLLLTRIYSIPYNYYLSVNQITMADIYTSAIKNYINVSDNNQNLYVENWASYEEPTSQSNILINQILGSNKKVIGIADELNPNMVTPEIKKLYQINGESKNRFPQKGDYVLIFTGNSNSYWQLRGVTPLVNDSSILLDSGYNLKLASEINLYHKLLFPINFIDFPKFKDIYLGYKLYQVIDDNNFASWQGRYSDGWVGHEASLTGFSKTKSLNIMFKIDVPNIKLPNKLTIMNGAKIIKEINLEKSGTFEEVVSTDLQHSGKYTLNFYVQNTFIPKNIGINNDTRSLGIQINRLLN